MIKNILLVITLLLNQIVFAQYNVSTFSGSGTTGHQDGNSASARYNRPLGITSDDNGNVYVCDFNNHCIRKIDTSGTVSTIAGDPGVSGFANGIGSAARFNRPGGICLDSIGNIYITDNFNNRIRKIDTALNVTTVAGNGLVGFINGIGTSAQLNVPRDIIIDNSNEFLYFVDRNDVVRRVELSNSNVTTFAGSGISGFINGSSSSARFNFPASISIDSKGNFYIADMNNHAIRKIDTSGTVSTFCGNGLSGSINGNGSLARFDLPTTLRIDNYDNIYVVDRGNDLVRKIDSNANVTTLAGDGTNGFLNGRADTARFGELFGIEVLDSNTIYVSDAANERIRLIKQEVCKSVNDTLIVNSCSFYLSPSENYSWNQSGTYFDTIQFGVNCDSLFTINLTIDTSTSIFNFESACGSYLSPSGKTYISSGLYYDTISNSKGCDSLITVFLTIDSSSTSTINITECNSYRSPSNRIFNRTGTYQDTILNHLGCDSIITINLTIDTITNGVTQIGNNLIANQNNVQYQWLDCNNAYSELTNDTNQSFSSFFSGSYAVEVSNTCIDTSSCFNLTIVGGVNNNKAIIDITLKPNPTSGNLFIKSTENIESLYIYSSNGKLVKKISNPSNKISVEQLPRGLYFIQLIGKNLNSTRKILLK